MKQQSLTLNEPTPEVRWFCPRRTDRYRENMTKPAKVRDRNGGGVHKSGGYERVVGASSDGALLVYFPHCSDQIPDRKS